jgi:site-specific recombinase XerD
MRRCAKLLPEVEIPSADRSAWEAATRPGDRFDDGGPAGHWRGCSKQTVWYAYRRWLGHLKRHDPASLGLPPPDRITEERLRTYIEALDTTMTPTGTHNYVKHLYDAARVMASDRRWAWLHELAKRLERLVVPPNKRPRMVGAAALVDLASSLMAKAEQVADREPRESALLYRDGLIIALLIARPVRRRNLAMIRIGQHLIRDEFGYRLVFEAHETKTHERYDTMLPDSLTSATDRYVAIHRPNIAGSDHHEGLWASMKGRVMTEEAIYDRVCKHTKAAFGHSINPHLFRDIAATTIAIEDPKNVRIASDLLGHSDPSMTDRFYIQAETVQASKRHQDVILAMRKEFRSRAKAKDRE